MFYQSNTESLNLIGLGSADYLGISVSSQEKIIGGIKARALSTSSKIHHKTALLYYASLNIP